MPTFTSNCFSILFAGLLLAQVSIAPSAEAQWNIEVTAAPKARDWDEARRFCLQLGQGWDLPTSVQYLTLLMAGETHVIKILKTIHSPEESPVADYHALWVRSDNEEANKKLLQGTSKVYFVSKAEAQPQKFQTLDASTTHIEYLQTVIKQIRNFPEADIRSEEEQKQINLAYKTYVTESLSVNKTYIGLVPELNSHEYVINALPSLYFSVDIKRSMLKVSRLTLERLNFNTQNILEAIEDGFPVTCVRSL